MTQRKKTLFKPVVALGKLHPNFKRLQTAPGYEPARRMLDEICESFDDPEGNFLEQFQTTSFDARFFELYLFAYFSRSGFSVNRDHVNPDFLVSRTGLTVAVESTTVGPPTSGVLAKLGKKISDLSEEDFAEYQQNELPIRFGSPLFSKLKKRYWETEHCRNLPFVIAIEAFHDDQALTFSVNSLARLLFGADQTATFMYGGKLKIDTNRVTAHSVGEKTVPSNFFAQPDAGHISAVMFTNSGTISKFARMGYQRGIGCKTIKMVRTGTCFNPDPDAKDPTFFSYDLDEPPLVESWGQGLIVLHNPNSFHPVPRDFFVEAVQGYMEGGVLKFVPTAWDVIGSKTLCLHLGEIKRKLAKIHQYCRAPRLAIGAITRTEFQEACGLSVSHSNPLCEEHGWFSDESNAFLGVITLDKTDKDWGYIVLARDEYFQFRAIEFEVSFPSREKALMKLQHKMVRLLSSPQRIFPQ